MVEQTAVYVASCACSDIQLQVRQRGQRLRIVQDASVLFGSGNGTFNDGTAIDVPHWGQVTDSRRIQHPMSRNRLASIA
jgi:hypothetical protein